MKCTEVEYLAPLYWSGELEPKAAAELEEHLQSCAGCAREIALQKHDDEMLRQAVMAEPVDDSAVVAKVQSEIAGNSHIGWRWNGRWAAAALVAAAALAIVTFLAIPRHSSSPQNQKPSVTALNILADAADDHHDEVVEHFQREWLYGGSEIRKLVQEKAGNAAVVTELAPQGYHIDRARICELGMRNYLHLVYSDGEHEVSMFVRQQDGEQLAGAEREKVNGMPLVADSYQKLQVAAFQSPRYTVVVVSDQPMDATLGFARKAVGEIREDSTHRQLRRPFTA